MLEGELQIAEEAVRKAGQLCRKIQQALVTDETVAKSDRSPVTVSDFASQAVINHALSQAFPEDSIVAEEDSTALRENAALRTKVMYYVNEYVPGLSEAEALEAIDRGSGKGGTGRFWTLDPIDGTKGYIRGDQYAVALALLEEGQVVLGAMGCPNLPYPRLDTPAGTGCVYSARKGMGVVCHGMDDGSGLSVGVSPVENPSEAVFCESFESGHSSHSLSDEIMASLGTSRPPVRIDSQAKYALVARGEASVYLRLPTRADYQEKIWDHAAGWLVVTEAGGTVTDVSGKPIDFSRGRTLADNKGVIVTNGRLQQAVLRALER